MAKSNYKKLKSMEKEEAKAEAEADRFSDLPDSIIHDILSFLPSTKQAIQTGVLSKRWRNQWTHIPVLIFDSTGMSFQNFLNFIQTTLALHDCSKIKKFHLEYDYPDQEDPQFTQKVRFATRKYVEDLFLSSDLQVCMLPKFLFNNDSLVKLTTEGCNFMPDFGEVNWRNLKSLSVSHCIRPWSDRGLECILSGSPLLESLELINCYGFKKFVVASKSLKRLVLDRLLMREVSFFEVSCPKLEELSLVRVSMLAKVFVPGIENVVYGSSLLKSFKLISSNNVERLVIASESLKRLVLEEIISAFDVEISCPKLENLKLSRCLNIKTVKLVNLSSLLCATLNFYRDPVLQTRRSLFGEILQQLHHVKELRIKNLFMEILSDTEAECLISPMLNIKCLTLIYPDLSKHHFGIARLLRNSPALEELVIDMTLYYQYVADLPKLDYVKKKFWNSNATVFDCLKSHLKTIKIIDFPKRGYKRKNLLNLVQFLLKNARVLEKMVVVLKDDRNVFPKVSQELLSFPRCSQHSIIEFAKL